MQCAGRTGGALGDWEHAGHKGILLLSRVSLPKGEDPHVSLGTGYDVQGARELIARTDRGKSSRRGNFCTRAIVNSLAMIGVIAKRADNSVVHELFELFKTPWEFYRDGSHYDVLVCSGDAQLEGLPAPLVITYTMSEPTGSRLSS